MAEAVVAVVSNRLRMLAFTGLCFIAAQLLISLSSCHPEHVPMAARISLSQSAMNQVGSPDR
jgi:hypothetical protein